MQKIRRVTLLILALLLVNAVSVAQTTFAQTPASVPGEITVDQDYLTLYIAGNQPVSLQDVYFTYHVGNQQKNTLTLNAYPSFSGISDWNAVPTPVCFFFVRQGTTPIPPLNCQSASPNLQKQLLSVSDVFWFNALTNQPLSFTAMSGTTAISPACGSGGAAICPVQIMPALTAQQNAQQSATAPVPAPRPTPQVQAFDGVPMVLVPAGCFMMGSDQGADVEKPVAQVCFDKSFWIDQTDVTNAQFATLKGKASHSSAWTNDNRPRESITWFEARNFCLLRGAKLPTEAEWEYAARGPNSLVYPWGNTFDPNNAVFVSNSGNQTADVGSKPGNISWAGAFDMVGNVWQWTSSLIQSYPYHADDGREDNADTTNKRVVRGGAFDRDEGFLRAPFRGQADPSSALSSIGFRCTRPA